MLSESNNQLSQNIKALVTNPRILHKDVKYVFLEMQVICRNAVCLLGFQRFI